VEEETKICFTLVLNLILRVQSNLGNGIVRRTKVCGGKLFEKFPKFRNRLFVHDGAWRGARGPRQHFSNFESSQQRSNLFEKEK